MDTKIRYEAQNTPAGWMIYDTRCVKFANSYPMSEKAAKDLARKWNVAEGEKRARTAQNFKAG